MNSENSTPKADWAEGREVSGGLRGRRKMGQVEWIVPVRNGAWVHMGLLGCGGECMSPILQREKLRLREGQPMSEVTPGGTAGTLALAWLPGQHRLTQL